MPRPASIAAALGAVTVLLLTTPDSSWGLEESPADPDAVSLKGRHSISIHAGIGSQGKTQAYVSGSTVSSDVNSGFLGLVSYHYGATSELTIGVGVGMLEASTDATVSPGLVSASSAAVTPILFGVDYYPLALAFSRDVRPYISISVGPCVGTATVERVGSGSVVSESVSESVFGARTAVGFDYFFGTRFKLGLAGGYHFVGDYSEHIGGDKNYSGPEGVIGFGVLLGEGH